MNKAPWHDRHLMVQAIRDISQDRRSNRRNTDTHEWADAISITYRSHEMARAIAGAKAATTLTSRQAASISRSSPFYYRTSMIAAAMMGDK